MTNRKEPLSLSDRIKRLEDLEAIKSLKRLQCFYAHNLNGDPGMIDEFAALFTDDAEFDEGLGFARGSREIAEQMHTRRNSPEYKKTVISGMHYYLTPYIELDGDRAKGTWSGLVPLILASDPRPAWFSLIYHERYVRIGNEWRFQYLKTQTVFEPPEFQKAYESFIPPGQEESAAPKGAL